MENIKRATKIGILVRCSVCGKRKAPRGRSVPLELNWSMCTSEPIDECPGYRQAPLPGDLWAGETDADFGYPCSDNATNPISA